MHVVVFFWTAEDTHDGIGTRWRPTSSRIPSPVDWRSPLLSWGSWPFNGTASAQGAVLRQPSCYTLVGTFKPSGFWAAGAASGRFKVLGSYPRLPLRLCIIPLDRFGECNERSSPPHDGTRYRLAASSRPGPAYRLPAQGPPVVCTAGALRGCLRRFVFYWPLASGVTGLMGGLLPFTKGAFLHITVAMLPWVSLSYVVAYRL